MATPTNTNKVSGGLNLGAAGTDINNLANYGALAKQLGQQLYPQRVEDPKDKWLTAFQFFSNMAAAASKPGATAIGAAGEAGATTVKTLLDERKQKRAEDLAATKMGATLAASLAKPKTFKQYPTGESAVYMSAEKAKQYLIEKGLPETAPTFNSLVSKLTAPTDSMIGKPLVIADSFQMLAPQVRGTDVVGFNLIPVTGGSKPGSVEFRQKRLPILAKNQDVVTKTFETLPAVNQAMDLLLTGQVETGGLAELTLPIKNIFGQIFGVDFPEVQNLQMIQSISNVLAPKMRPVGSGSTSDMEFKAYQRAIADVGNTPESNYISLYTFMKKAENSRLANQTELEILTSGGTAKDVNEAIMKIDPGIYETYKGPMDNENEFNSWVTSLPRGAVIYNRAPDGKKLFDDDNRIFIIKGFGSS